MKTKEIKKITVVTDNTTCDQCLYVDGHRWADVGETTVYACDIAEYANNEAIRFEHRPVDMPAGGWPKTLSELLGTSEDLGVGAG